MFWTIKTPSRKIKIVPAPFVSVVFSKSDRLLGPVHDFLWQVAALLLGTQFLSGAEFEALFGALERSARKWALRPVSRFYVAYLHQTLEGASE